MLDGGVTAWAHDGHEMESAAVHRAPSTYEVEDIDLTVVADREEVVAALGDPDTVIVDTRSPAEYRGLQPTAARDGHIPGAVNIDVAANFQAGTDGIVRLQAESDLRALYETAGITPEKRVIVHCQSGSRSSETFLVLKSLGYERVQNYAAGWQEWGNLPDTPVETS